MTLPYLREAGALLLVVALGASHVYAYRQGGRAVQAKFDAYVAQGESVATTQRDENRERAVEIEERVLVQTVYRDRYITQTVKEIQRATEPLAACPVPADAVRLLNDAARCAREDRPASCGADGAVPGAG